MDFTQVRFVVFVVLLSIAYRFCPARRRVALLAAVSYLFYCTWSVTMALMLVITAAAVFWAARALESASERKRRWIMIWLVAGLVGLLAIFKSAGFLRGILHYGLLMPLGLSYYTFKLISYVLDVYWRTMPAESDFLRFAAYVAFFPQIVAGPIQRSQSFLKQLYDPKPASFDTATLGLQRILLGFFKKLVVADGLAVLVNFVYGNVHSSGTPMLVGYYVYPFQLYADFSGLTDIAIGAALLLGIESPENFSAPFAAPNPTEFWRRWHITLSSWLMDYVYTPMRMATRTIGNIGLVLSLFITMVLIGIWHGFRWGFVVFGLVHAVYLSVDALTSRARKKYYKKHPAADRVTNWFGPLVTFHLAATGFVVFRAASLQDALYMLEHLMNGLSAPSPEFLRLVEMSVVGIGAGIVGYVLIEIADYLRRHNQHNELLCGLPRWGRWSVYSCTITTAIIMVLLMFDTVRYSPFIYEIF
jgi:D-alanyl-lipoteichoic acid acyltransferase DltB (MBOAT superfamily)